ncbi:MAG: hypothetical protein GY928_15605 [Colwellia sp.]|nr:hypothetical protein [Colwellia sp.]
MMKSLSVIFILSVALMLIAKGEVYFGFVTLLIIFFTVMKLAASSVYGDFSKTPEEIIAAVKKHKKIDIDYLSYPEQLAMKEQQRQQRVRDRARECAKRKAKAKRLRRVYLPVESSCTSGDSPWDDSVVPTFIEGNSDTDDDYQILQNDINSPSVEEIYVNPSTGLIMVGGMAGVDSSGHCWGQSDWDDNLSSDCFSSLDDSFNSFDDSNDSFVSCDMEE